MQIIIDTRQCPCRTLNDKCDIINKECYEDDIYSSCPLIRNGGVKLPKGHGRLIDAKDVGEYLTLADVPTIIEADKESER